MYLMQKNNHSALNCYFFTSLIISPCPQKNSEWVYSYCRFAKERKESHSNENIHSILQTLTEKFHTRYATWRKRNGPGRLLKVMKKEGFFFNIFFSAFLVIFVAQIDQKPKAHLIRHSWRDFRIAEAMDLAVRTLNGKIGSSACAGYTLNDMLPKIGLGASKMNTL